VPMHRSQQSRWSAHGALAILTMMSIVAFSGFRIRIRVPAAFANTAAPIQHCRRPALHLRRSVAASTARRATQGGGDDVASWSARELRSYLAERQVAFADCFEKRELVARVRETMERAASSDARTSPSDSSAAEFSSFGPLVRLPSANQDSAAATFIFLHGLGDSAQGWASRLPDLVQMPELRYVLPTAPTLSFSGMPGGGVNSWFDASVLGSMMGGASMGGSMQKIGPAAMEKSIRYCHHLIRQELASGVQPRQVFVGGFSQGGCVAMRAALSFPQTLGGCVAASTFLGDDSRLEVSEANARLAILSCHGEADQMVPTSEGRRSADCLRDRGMQVEWRSYPGMGHSACPDEAQDVRNFIKRQLLLGTDAAAFNSMSARELKALLRNLGIDTSSCFDRRDLVDRARSAGLMQAV